VASRSAGANPERSRGNYTLHEVAQSLLEPDCRPLRRILFDAATAFADVRRLQILRRLARGEEATAATLGQELKMSPWAVARQTDKLMRRGYLRSRETTETAVYRLAETFKTPIHAALWELVRSTWKSRPLHTS